MDYAPPTDLNPIARDLIRRKVRACGFSHPDAEDFEQELALHVLVKTKRYDPSRASPATFYAHLIDRKAIDLWRAATAAKRGRGQTWRVEDFDGMAAPGTDTALARTDLRLDVSAAVGGLIPELRDLADALMAGGVAQAARATGRTRGRVRHGCSKLARHLRNLEPLCKQRSL